MELANKRGAAYLLEIASKQPTASRFPIDRQSGLYTHPTISLFNSTSSPPLASSPPPIPRHIHSHIQRSPLISLHSNTVSATYTPCPSTRICPPTTVARASTSTPSRTCAASPPPQPRPTRRLAHRGLQHPRPSQTRLSHPQLILRPSPRIILHRILWSTRHPQSPRHTHSRSSHPHL